jgi:hypothetical protein
VTDIVLFRRSLILLALLIVGLGSAACSGGGPIPAASTTTSVPSSVVVSNPVAAIDPCSLLSQSDVARLGLTSRGHEDTAKSRGCGWSKGAVYAIGIYANRSQGLSTLRDSTSTSVSLVSHDAIQTASDIDCMVDIAITKTSSVGISIEAGGGNACGYAAQYATLIEPKLPAQQK